MHVLFICFMVLWVCTKAAVIIWHISTRNHDTPPAAIVIAIERPTIPLHALPVDVGV